jgi:hypothetical protein
MGQRLAHRSVRTVAFEPQRYSQDLLPAELEDDARL